MSQNKNKSQLIGKVCKCSGRSLTDGLYVQSSEAGMYITVNLHTRQVKTYTPSAFSGCEWFDSRNVKDQLASGIANSTWPQLVEDSRTALATLNSLTNVSDGDSHVS